MTDASGQYLVCEKVQAISPENENIIQMQQIYEKNENYEYKIVKTIFGFICGLSLFFIAVIASSNKSSNKNITSDNKIRILCLICLISGIIAIVFEIIP